MLIRLARRLISGCLVGAFIIFVAHQRLDEVTIVLAPSEIEVASKIEDLPSVALKTNDHLEENSHRDIDHLDDEKNALITDVNENLETDQGEETEPQEVSAQQKDVLQTLEAEPIKAFEPPLSISPAIILSHEFLLEIAHASAVFWPPLAFPLSEPQRAEF